MRKIIVLVTCGIISTTAFAAKTESSGGYSKVANAGNYTIGFGPVGNFFVTRHRPELSPGIGAVIYFDYRWSPQISTTASIMMTNQSGKNRDVGENNVIFLGIPSFDVKYYFITEPSRLDPYVSGGIGFYVLTSGSRNGGLATGLGAQLGTGIDYYLSSKLSIGVATQFHSIGMFGGGTTGSFPISMMGNLGFHF